MADILLAGLFLLAEGEQLGRQAAVDVGSNAQAV